MKLDIMPLILLVKYRPDILIDEDDLDKFSFVFCRISAYNYVITNKKNGDNQIQLHRLILPTKLYVDHINCNRLDNRKCNLREATASQNSINVALTTRNKSGYKGVCWNKARRKFVAAITLNNKAIYISAHNNMEDAARSYDRTAKRLFGEFAVLNFPD